MARDIHYGVTNATPARRKPPCDVTWLAAMGCHVTALTFCLVSVATGPWLQGDITEGHVTLGVWEACLDSQCMPILSEEKLLDVIGRWIQWVQAFAASGAALLCLSQVMSIAALTFKQELRTGRSGAVIAGVTSAGGVLFLTALLIFGFKVWLVIAPHSGHTVHFGSSLVAGWFGVFMTSLAVLFYILHATSLANRRLSGYIELK